MKILTWNINGIRAVTRDKTLKEFLDSLKADVICFQETKITRDMLEEGTCIVDGYNAYFSFSRVKTGYSGVATFCKDSAIPCAAEEGLSSLLTSEPSISCYGDVDDFTQEELSKLDNEGRTVLTEHALPGGDKVVIINVYCPRVDLENEERIKFKLEFHKLLSRRVEGLLESGKHVIVLGDINAAHKPIDHCNPGESENFLSRPGRAWLDEFLVDLSNVKSDSSSRDEANNTASAPISTHDELIKPAELSTSISSVVSDEYHGDENEKQNGGLLADSFRYFHPTQKGAYTNWCTLTGARQTNYGTRIDYIMADVSLIESEFINCLIQPEVEGSDHCPVVCELKTDFVPGVKPPPLCTKYMPEFAGKQQKLMAFFSKKSASSNLAPLPEEREKGLLKNTEQLSSEEKLCESNSKKRPASVSSTSSNPVSKRTKKTQHTKQNSLLRFFGQKQKSANSVTSGKIESQISKPSLAKDNCGFSEGVTEEDVNQTENGCHSNSEESSSQTTSESSSSNSVKDASSVVQIKSNIAAWKSILKGPAPAPLCPGHNEPSVLRTVKKKGPNYGRQFHCCARPEGHASNKDARCKFFKWVK